MTKREERLQNLYAYDAAYGNPNLCGIDEAGRGCLAGPVFAAAVILPESPWPADLNDSKKIAEKKRYVLAQEIKSLAKWGVGMASPQEVDAIGIQQANFLAFKRALDHLAEQFDVHPKQILIDGNYKNTGIACSESVVKGDTKSACIAAASILAKTGRDQYVIDNYEPKAPEYGFAKHKGYGTKQHREAILAHGLTPWHRKTFCRAFTGAAGKITQKQTDRQATSGERS
jgi:ribonuclease HII